MKAKWSGVVFLMATALLAQSQNAGKSADQLRDLANQAKNSKDIEGEVSYFCQASALDEKKYGKKCKQVKEELSKLLAQFQADFAMGSRELQQKDYGGALRDLQKITFGPNKAGAQELMQQARIGLNGGIPIDPASLIAFKTAREAYLRGDFGLAESQLRLVQSPPLHAAANQILTNINVYRDTMKQAEALFQTGDLKEAEHKFQFAASILPTGPGSPLDRLRDVLTAEAKIEVAKQSAADELAKHSAADDIRPALQVKPSPTKLKHTSKSKDVFDSRNHQIIPNSTKDMRQTETNASKKGVSENSQEEPQEIIDCLNRGLSDFMRPIFRKLRTLLAPICKTAESNTQVLLVFI